MFEVIGIVVVGWFAFKLLRYFFGGAVLGMQIRAVDYASEYGVPREFSAYWCEHPEIIKQTIQTLSRIEPGFAKGPGSEKYGKALVYLYAGHLQEEAKKLAKDLAAAKGKLVSFVKPQLEQLESGGYHLYLNEVAYAYVTALASNMVKGVVSLEQIHDLMPEVFKDKTNSRALEHAHLVAQHAPDDFAEKLAALMPVAKLELATGKGEYLVKYIRKLNYDFEQGSSGSEIPHRDLSEVSLQSYLGLGA